VERLAEATEPGRIKPGRIKPGRIKPGRIKPGRIKPGCQRAFSGHSWGRHFRAKYPVIRHSCVAFSDMTYN
jgi:hypothetical protein